MKPQICGKLKKKDSSLWLERGLKTDKVAEVGENWIIKALHEMLKV